MKKKIFGFIIFTLLFAMAGFCATLTENIEKEFPFKPNNKLTVENVNGGITIEEWEKEIVRIEVTKISKAQNDSDAKEALNNVKVDFLTTPFGVSVSVKSEKSLSFFSWLWGKGSSVEVNFNIKIPKAPRLDLNSVNGSTDVNVKEAEVVSETVNGNINVKGSSLLTASTVNGSIEFETENITKIESVNGTIRGTILSQKPRGATIETVNGQISIRLLQTVSVSLSIENVNGSIRTDFKEIEGTKREKSGDINGGGETISIEAVNGSIEVSAITPGKV